MNAARLFRSSYLVPLLLAGLLGLTSLGHFLLFHTLAELFTIGVGLALFMLAWLTYPTTKNHILLFLGCGYFWIALLDGVHAFTYMGMPFLAASDPDPATLFWLLGRYLESIVLLSAPLTLRTPLSRGLVFSLFGAVVISVGMLAASGIFPPAYIPEQGLTSFKVVSEYVIMGLLLAAIIHLAWRRPYLERDIFLPLIASIILTILAEFCFTLYVNVYGPANLIGHLLKFLSYWLIFRAVIHNALLQPIQEMARGTGAYEALPDATLVIDRAGVIHQANRSARLESGLASSQLLGRHLHRLAHDPQQPLSDCPVCQAITQGRSLDRFQLALPVVEQWREITLGSIRMAGFLSGMIHVSRDVTAAKEMTTALRQAHQYLESMVADRTAELEEVNSRLQREIAERRHVEQRDRRGSRIAHLGHWEWDPIADRLLCSPELFAILGREVSEDQMVFDDLIDAAHPEDRPGLRERIDATLAGTASGFDFECRIQRLDGSIRAVHATSELIRDQEGAPLRLFGTFQDISPRKEIERALVSAREAAEEANRAKSRFLANMSHEIRTPMHTITGMGHLALESANLDPQVKDYLEKIQISSRTLLRLLDDILDFSRVEAGKLTLESIPFDLVQLLDNLEKTLSERIDPERVALNVTLEPGTPRHLLGDPVRLTQILTNLGDNAAKFTPAGHIAIVVQGETTLLGGAQLHLSVSDTGVGMEPEQAARVFDLFEQGDQATTRRYGGSGLGLAICRRLVEIMGGQLALDTAPGAGCRFLFSLPFGIAPPPQPVSRESEVAPNEKPTGGRILLVEDYPFNRELGQEILQRKGFEVHTACNGQEAVQYVLEGADPVDLVLMDVQMPVMDGLTAARTIRQDARFKDLPIIAMTASALKEDVARCLEAGMDDHVAKPLEMSRLMAVLQERLGKRS